MVNRFRYISILPNALSVCNFLCGIQSMRYAILENFHNAAYLIFLGMVFDYFDGKVARATKSVSQLGTYLDSLSDLTTFGIAPVVFLYTFLPAQFSGVKAFILLLYPCCGLIRIARYNLNLQKRTPGMFMGIPIPASAGSLISFILIYIHFPSQILLQVLSLAVILNSFLMVSKIPYEHLARMLDWLPKWAKWGVLGLAAVSVILGYFYVVLFICFWTYIVWGAFKGLRQTEGLKKG